MLAFGALRLSGTVDEMLVVGWIQEQAPRVPAFGEAID